MKLAAVLGIGLLFVLMTLWDSHDRQSSQPLEALKPAPLALSSYRRPLPDFKWNTSGSPMDLGQLKTKVSLISFWADWCWPCHREMPYLVELAQKLPADKYNVWLINLDEPGSARQKAERYWQDKGYPTPFVALDKSQVSGVFEVDQLPYHVVVGPEGQILWQGSGAFHWQADHFQKTFRHLLDSSTPE